MTSFTPTASPNNLVIKAFCAARYGSALLHWLKATKNCFSLAGFELEHPTPSRSRTRTVCLMSFRSSLPLNGDGKNNDNRLDHHLDIAIHVIQAQHVGENPDRQRADDGSWDRSFAARESGTADDDSGNRIQYVADAGIAIALMFLTGVQHSSKTRQEPGESVHPNLDAAEWAA